MSSSRKPASVREPIQVYLTKADRQLLDRVSEASGVSRAEILRRGLRQYGGTLLAEPNPVVAFLDEMSAGPWPDDMPNDVGRRHDEYLTESYRPPSQPKRGRR